MRYDCYCVKMEVTQSTRKLIISLKQQGQPLRKIAKTINKSHSRVQHILLNRHKHLQTSGNKPRSGRPRKVKAIHKRTDLKTNSENPKTIAPVVTKMLADDCGLPVQYLKR